MHCSKCGAQLADGAVFCGSCGTAVTPTQPEPQVQYQAPQPQPPYQVVYQVPAQRGLTKKEFLATQAPDSVKKRRKLGAIAALVCVVILLIGYITVYNTSIFELPMISLILDIGNVDLDELDDDLDALDDEMKILKNSIKHGFDVTTGIEIYDLTSDQKDAIEDYIDAMEDLADTPSLAAIQKVAKAVDQVVDEDAGDVIDFYDSDASELTLSVGMMNIFLIAGLVWVLIFTVLGALLKNKAIMVVSLIFSLFYTLPLCSIVITVLSIVAHVVAIVLLSAGDKEYLAYRSGAVTY